MGKKCRPPTEQIPLDEMPIRECCSCGAFALDGSKVDVEAVPHKGPQPLICSITLQLYRNGGPKAGPSFRLCDKCLQAALVTPVLFESPEGQVLLTEARRALKAALKRLLEEENS